MDNEKLLQIVLKARDEASATISNMGNQLSAVAKKSVDMSASFKVAGGILTGVGLAGVGMMKTWVDAAADHQVAMASVDVTLKNVAATMGQHTVVVGANATSVKENKKAIDDHIRSLKEQKMSLELATGSHKTEISAIDKEIKAQELLKLQAQDVTVSKGKLMAVNTGVKVSEDSLKKVTDDVATAYTNLGFKEDDTSKAFARDLMVTGNITDAKKLLAASADFARLKQEDLGTATQQLSMAYAGNEKALKQLGITLPKGTKGMEAITAVTKAAGGQAEDFAKTYEGAMQRMSANIDKFKISLGERLLPTIQGFADGIAKMVEKLNALSPKTLDTIVKIVAFGSAFSLASGAVLLFVGFLPNLMAGFALLTPAILPIAGILAAVAAAGYLLYTHWNQVVDIFTAAKPKIEAVVNQLKIFWTEIQPKLKIFFDWFIGDITKFATEIWTRIQPGIQAWQTAITQMTQFLQAHWDQIKIIFEVALAAIAIVLAVAWEGFKTTIKLALDVISGNWKNVWEDIKGFFVGIWNDINALTGGQLDKMAKTISDTVDHIKQFFVTMGISIAQAFNTVLSDLKNMVNGMIDIVNNLIKGVNGVSGKIPGGKAVQIPEIPHFAQGGYVPQTGIAVVHQGEFVLSKAMLAGQQAVPSQVKNITTHNQPINIYATVNEQMDLNLLGNRVAFAVRNSR